MFSRPKKLYKYLSAEGAQKLFSMEKPTLWFRLPNRLNDVFDLRPVGSYTDEFGTIATFCLSENPVSAPMWAHYGSNGEGVVLEFSMQSDFFLSYLPVKVRYKKSRPTVNNVRDALITKSDEWAYEREWRCFVTPPQKKSSELQFLASEQAVSTPFPFNALAAIIRGHDCRVDPEQFLAMLETAHVKQLVCRANASCYGFSLRTLDDWSYIVEHQNAAMWGRKQKRK